ncbi:hypothetical protein KQI36_00245 [Clostridium senegalense]|uniref:hypothetical protein n=1 Tax=Clostridium senegalense TaxID=1465809 RepID=UPI001C10A81B|nr:hypothetical protein [Clostridium senegalense]MBU5225092.1 hypothetical protein [Clostridium senegalense]
MVNSLVSSNVPQELKTQIYGINSNQPVAIQTDSNGNLITQLSNTDGTNNPYSIPLTAFNDLRTIALTPMAGWTFNYNINSDYIITTTANGGTATQGDSMAILSTTTANNGSSKIATRKVLRYSPGLGGLARFTAVFTTGVSNSQQIIGLGDDTDGFYFGYNGTDFSILRIQNGTLNWISQTNWNVDKMNGTGPSGMTLDPTKGNVYTIQFQWLGFGVINYYVTSTTTGQPILVHRIEYPNTAIVPSVYNPSFPLTAKVVNSGNTSNVVLKTTSAMAFCEGDGFSQAIITRNSVSNSVALTTPTNQNVLTLLNTSTFVSKVNRTRIRLDFVSTSVDGAKAVNFKLIRNATFGTTLSYTPINANTSVIQYSTTQTSATGGIQIFTFEVPINLGAQLNLTSLNIFLAPGETLTLQATSSNNNQVDCALSWEELW